MTDPDITTVVAGLLGIPVSTRRSLGAYSGPVHPDLCFDHEGTVYLVRLKSTRAAHREVERLSLQRLYFQDRIPAKAWRLVIAAPAIDPAALADFERISGTFLRLRGRPRPPRSEARTGVRTQLTSPAAWAVAYEILRAPDSIRAVAGRAGVSYAWAHRTVRAMERRGLLLRRGGRVAVADRGRFLSGVAWERPLASLQVAEFETAYRAPLTLTRDLSARSPDVAITGPAHLLLSTDVVRSVDRVDAYVPSMDLLEGLVGKGEKQVAGGPAKGGLRLYAYRVDRALQTQEIQGTRVVDPGQAILDLAGMGPNWFDLAVAVIESARGR